MTIDIEFGLHIENYIRLLYSGIGDWDWRLGIEIGDWDWGLGIGDWDMGLGLRFVVGDLDSGFVLAIEIGDSNWGLGFWTKIEDCKLAIGSGIGIGE